MEALLIKYGYVICFLGVMVEGESFLLAASFLAHRGTLHLPLVILVAIAANTAADQIYYTMARIRGRAWLLKRFGDNPHYAQVMRWMSRKADWLLLASRFLFGFRIIIPAACGALGMPPLRFSLLNLIAGAIWAIPTALLGYYFGNVAALLFAGVKRYELWTLLFLALIAGAILVVRHLRHAEWIEDLELADLHRLVPYLIALMGLINLISAIWPRTHPRLVALEAWLPLEVTQPSRPLMLFAGLALLQVTRNLARRKELAWYVAVIALGVSLLTHATHGFDLQHSLVAGLLLIYLFSFRRRFYARSDPASLRLGFLMTPILFVAVLAYGYSGFSRRRDQFVWPVGSAPLSAAFQEGILIRDGGPAPLTQHAEHFLDSLGITGWLARFYLLLLFLRPVILRDRQEASKDFIERIFKAYSRFSLSAFAIQADKHHLQAAGSRGLIAYASRGSVALACGDPLASEDDLDQSIRDFLEYCRRNGWTPCFYEAAEARLPIYHSLGLRSLKMAEEAILDLHEFTLVGGKRASLRAMVNKAAKSGLAVDRYNRKEKVIPAFDEQLEAISQEWLAEKRMSEMGFTMGRFSLEALNELFVFIAMIGEKAEAFCSYMPYRNGSAAVLDLMRKRKTAPAGTMDFLITHALLQLKSSGLAEASLGNAPLANVSQQRGALDKGVALLFENMNSFYGYKNLFLFKKKFVPNWEGRYLVYPTGADLPRVAYALTSVHSAHGLLRLLAGR